MVDLTHPGRGWYLERLDDVRLLDRVVVLPDVDGFSSLAVPVGGKRRGGFIPFGDLLDALIATRRLAQEPERLFPHVRLIVSGDSEVAYDVAWGDFPPEPLDEDEATDERIAALEREVGRFYGYSEAAIDAYLAGRDS